MWLCSFAGYSGFGFELSRPPLDERLDLAHHLASCRAACRLEALMRGRGKVEAKTLGRRATVAPRICGNVGLWGGGPVSAGAACLELVDVVRRRLSCRRCLSECLRHSAPLSPSQGP